MIGGNLSSSKAATNANLFKFFSKSFEANVPMQPLNAFFLPVVQVTNKGNFLFFKEFGKQLGISFLVK